MTTPQEEIEMLMHTIEQMRLEMEHVLDAIRAHRASKTPSTWSRDDAKLYDQLPEVRHTGLGSG